MKPPARGAKAEARCGLVEDGFEVVPEVLSEHQCESLIAELSALYQQRQVSAGGRLGGLRDLLRVSPRVAELARSGPLKRLLAERLGRNVFPVRALFFDKTPRANWSVSWHQDLAIAVVERMETPGFSGWSVKHGVPHVQPPGDVLGEMATIRLHLDDCRAANGALKVIPGSHRQGKMDEAAVEEWVRRPARLCEVPRGGALLMRPLLLHSSSPAAAPSHRRVLHVEYATAELPNGLKWFVS